MIVGAFDGADIVAVPRCPGFRSVQFDMSDTVGTSSSPFTMQTQSQYWPGGDMWSGTVELPALDKQNSGLWMAFLAQLRGMKNVFRLGDPLRSIPLGAARGLPVLDGEHAAMASQVHTKCWQPHVARQLVEGDYLQIGERLHIVLEPVHADSDGEALIKIWPNLREAVASDTPVKLNSPTGLFRLADNKRTISTDYTRLARLSLKIVEAR